MALRERRLFYVLLILLNECSPCFADDADPSVWNVKDDIKFGVAEPNLEVRDLFWFVCFLFQLALINRLNFQGKSLTQGGVWNLLFVDQRDSANIVMI